jgi:hypothetical protein
MSRKKQEEPMTVAPAPLPDPFITIAVTAADGSVVVVRTIVNTDEAIERELATMAELWSKSERTRHLVPVQSWRRVDAEAVPADREYRGAWRDSGAGPIVHDMKRARAIHRDRLRAARAPLLSDLDVATIRADEDGDTRKKAAAVARKRALRDAPADARIDQAADVAALRSLTLDVLAPE